MKKITLVSILLAWSLSLNVFAQFVQSPLPYAYNALEPFIDAQTMEIHYSKHHVAYITNLNKAIAGTAAEKMDIISILSKVSTFSPAVRNNAGGHYNHDLFWSILTPNKNTMPSAMLSLMISKTFGPMDSLKVQLNKAAATRFGSGWAWLYVTTDGKLAICSTANQDNPLMDNAENKGTPILGIDVWEHAYYLKYQNKRNDYLAALWNIINWDEVSRRYEKAVVGKK
jgi:superoxide dismutase, Fe-Mn family